MIHTLSIGLYVLANWFFFFGKCSAFEASLPWNIIYCRHIMYIHIYWYALRDSHSTSSHRICICVGMEIPFAELVPHFRNSTGANRIRHTHAINVHTCSRRTGGTHIQIGLLSVRRILFQICSMLDSHKYHAEKPIYGFIIIISEP